MADDLLPTLKKPTGDPDKGVGKYVGYIVGSAAGAAVDHLLGSRVSLWWDAAVIDAFALTFGYIGENAQRLLDKQLRRIDEEDDERRRERRERRQREKEQAQRDELFERAAYLRGEIVKDLGPDADLVRDLDRSVEHFRHGVQPVELFQDELVRFYTRYRAQAV